MTTTLERWAWLYADLNGRTLFGQPGVRDPEHPCEDFDPGDPHPMNVCGGDGHYMCDECSRLTLCAGGCGQRPTLCECPVDAVMDRDWTGDAWLAVRTVSEAMGSTMENGMDSSDWEARAKRDGGHGVQREAHVDWVAHSSDGFPDKPLATAPDRGKLIAELLKRLGLEERELDEKIEHGDIFLRRRVVATAYHDDEGAEPSIEWIDDLGSKSARSNITQSPALITIAPKI